VANVAGVIGKPASVSASAAALRRNRVFGSVGINCLLLWFARKRARWHEKETQLRACTRASQWQLVHHF
jgi:hypothetical protein